MSKKAGEGQQHEGNEGSENSGEGSGKSTEVSAQDLMKRIEQLEATNARLLNESKSEKQRRKELESTTETKAREEAERAGNFEKLYKDELKRTANLTKQIEVTRKSTIKANIRAQVAKFATDAVDLDDVLNQPKFSHLLEGGVDEESMNFSEEVAKTYVAEVYKAKPWLRKGSDTPNVANKFGARGTGATEKGGLTEKSNSELVALGLAGLK